MLFNLFQLFKIISIAFSTIIIKQQLSMEVDMRWYDIEPDVCVAISMLEMAPFQKRKACAKFVLEKIKSQIMDNEIQKALYEVTKNESPSNRAYDKELTFKKAVECLKSLPTTLQIKISKEALEHLNCMCV